MDQNELIDKITKEVMERLKKQMQAPGTDKQNPEALPVSKPMMSPGEMKFLARKLLVHGIQHLMNSKPVLRRFLKVRIRVHRLWTNMSQLRVTAQEDLTNTGI